MTTRAFESLPENKPISVADALERPITAALGRSRIVKISMATEKEKMGRRMELGRRAKKTGFAIEIRYDSDFMTVRWLADPART
jgi:hypothetical protein